MNKLAQQLVAALKRADIEPRTDYSGRGMFGVRCVGVSCGGRRDVSEGDVLEAVKNVRGGLRPSHDAMGLGTILYWPSAVTFDPDERPATPPQSQAA